MDSEWSVRDSLREVRSRSPLIAAPASGSRSAHSKLAAPGRIITSTPTKPTRIAIQMRRETFSPSTGADSAATKIGLAKTIAVTVASGSRCSALRIKKVPTRNSPPRANVSHVSEVIGSSGTPAADTTATHTATESTKSTAAQASTTIALAT